MRTESSKPREFRNSINHAKKRPERVQTRVNVSPLCASVCAIGYTVAS